MPHHDRKSGQQFHPRLWPHHRLSRRLRLRHPRRWRHRLFRRGRHPLLRSPAGKGDGLGAVAGGSRSRAWTARCANIASAASPPIWPFWRRVLTHPKFRANDYTTRFIDETPELFAAKKRKRPRDQAADLYRRRHRQRPSRDQGPRQAARRRRASPSRRSSPTSARRRRAPSSGSNRLGPEKFAAWMRGEKRVLVTDTTMRDAHQSLLATRMRTLRYARAWPTPIRDGAAAIAVRWNAGAAPPSTSRCAFSTRTRGSGWRCCAKARPIFCPDAAARRQRRRLHQLSRQCRAPLHRQAAEAGMDLFRIFDCLNWVENMRVAIDAVREAGKLAEGAICYTGDILDPDRPKYSLALLCRPRQGAGKGRLPHPRPSRTWRGCSSPPPRARWSGRCARRSACRSTSIPMTPRASRPPPCSPRSTPASTRSTRRWTPCRGRPRSLAWARSSRPCGTPIGTPGSIPRRSGGSASIGRPCAPNMRLSKAT